MYFIFLDATVLFSSPDVHSLIHLIFCDMFHPRFSFLFPCPDHLFLPVNVTSHMLSDEEVTSTLFTRPSKGVSGTLITV